MRCWNCAVLIVCALCQMPWCLGQGIPVDREWTTVKDVSLIIKAGSPLDFSALFPLQQGPIADEVKAADNGVFTIRGKPVRFLCAAMNLTPPYGGFPTREQSDQYAIQLRRSGYNAVRIQHIDSTLMTNREKDFEYDPGQLERFHYFLFALKKQGIYWMLDLMSSENGAFGGVVPHRWVNRHDLKAKLYVEESALHHWRRLVETLYGKVNPYTGVSILKDPALMAVNTVNEGGLQFLTHIRKGVAPVLVPALRGWLLRRYREDSEFELIWKQPRENLLSGALELPTPAERSERSDDLLSFFDDLQERTARWMVEQLRELGYRGLISGFNNMPTTHAIRSRAPFRLVDMHAYHDEAFGFQPGALMRNDSSFDKQLGYITDIAMARLTGRAFSVSEYGQPFWNGWRREAALVGPGYAAFQGWGALCQHASTAVDLTYSHRDTWKKAIIPYAVGLDPIGRVVETLAVLLYRRGDVAEGSGDVEVVLPGGRGEATSRYWGVPSGLAKVALVSRVRVRLAEDPPVSPAPLATVTVSPESQVSRKLSEWVGATGVSLGSGADALESVARVHDSHNKTNSRGGIYETNSGELFADLRSRRLEVRTQMTRAIVFERLEAPFSLGPMKVLSSDGPALVALSSLDGAILEHSQRLLLIVASDALNSKMLFKDSNRRELVALGQLPPRVEPRRTDIEITSNRDYRIRALAATGEPREDIAVVRRSGAKSFSVDLAALKSGPTFYFLVERASLH